MKIKILPFGIFTDIFDTHFWETEKALSIQELIEELSTQYPQIKTYTFRVAINKVIIEDHNTRLQMDDEMALLPPFSGG